jgi:hypothetical protein
VRTIWKWVLGIVVVLLVCAVLGGVGFFFARGSGANLVRAMPVPGRGSWSMPMHPGFHGPNGGQQDFGPGMYGHMRMHGYGGFFPFGMGFMMLGGLFRLLIPLVLIALVGVGAYLLGRNSARPATVSPAAPPPPEAPLQPPPPPTDAVEPAAEEPGEPS